MTLFRETTAYLNIEYAIILHQTSKHFKDHPEKNRKEVQSSRGYNHSTYQQAFGLMKQDQFEHRLVNAKVAGA